MPAPLRKQFPSEVTIVLQHQFWNLAVDDAGFSVTLRFSGRPERLVVPWPALRAFVDPSVEFGFRLQPGESLPRAAGGSLRRVRRARAGGDAESPSRPSPRAPGRRRRSSRFRRPDRTGSADRRLDEASRGRGDG